MNEIGVSAQDRRRVDLVLEVGQVAESITTTAEAPLLDTESATASRVVSDRMIGESPLNSRILTPSGERSAAPAVRG